MACAFFGLECKVYMVRVSYNQKPYRRALMEAYGASVTASPSTETESGRAILAEHPDTNGSLGIAISEAVEVAAKDPNTKYALGSVLNHVLLHQTVIGLEAMEQMELAGDEPDVIIGCTGGGSNFAGLVMPYVGRKIKGQCNARIVAVEPAACPSLTKGPFKYDFGDTGHLTPLVKMHTLGSTFIPPGIHAGGLRYHGMAPLVSHVLELGLIEASTIQQLDAFAAGIQFARAEGIIPAPEANHAVAAAIREALQAKAEVNRARFSSASPATDTSTCSPTSTTRPANWRTTTTPLKRSQWRWLAFRQWSDANEVVNKKLWSSRAERSRCSVTPNISSGLPTNRELF
jgi:tryptophan synthase beta chain